jgi:hypothetical protein
MPGLDPGIHLATARTMDCRVEPGNDGVSVDDGQRSLADLLRIPKR